MFIDGRWTDSSDGAVSSVINPATGVCVDTVPEATEQDVDRAIALAVEGQKEWNDIPLHEKLSILERYCVLLTENTEKIASIMCEEGGKPIEQCRTEVAANAAIFRIYCAAAYTFTGSRSHTMPSLAPRGTWLLPSTSHWAYLPI